MCYINGVIPSWKVNGALLLVSMAEVFISSANIMGGWSYTGYTDAFCC